MKCCLPYLLKLLSVKVSYETRFLRELVDCWSVFITGAAAVARRAKAPTFEEMIVQTDCSKSISYVTGSVAAPRGYNQRRTVGPRGSGALHWCRSILLISGEMNGGIGRNARFPGVNRAEVAHWGIGVGTKKGGSKESCTLGLTSLFNM